MKFTMIDRLLMVLAAAVIVLFAFGAMQTLKPWAVPENETTATEPTPSLCVDVVMLAVTPGPTAMPGSAAVPEPSPTPDPSSTPEPDKPAYNPAIPLSEDLQYILWAGCEEHGVKFAVALGLIEVESDFRTNADNGLCHGLTQLNRRYFPDNSPPGENIQYGVEYLGQLLARYDTVEAALCAYNAGHDTGKRGYANAVLAAAERWRDSI